MTGKDDEIEAAFAAITSEARHLVRLARARRTDRGDAAATARRLRNLHAQRKAIVPAVPFGDPAWDLLLALFIAHDEHQEIAMTALCERTDIAQATGTRWLERLEGAGLIARRTPDGDERVKLCRLTDEGARSMRRLLGAF
jgi:DNA-binding transcriptional ArsR family regulator